MRYLEARGSRRKFRRADVMLNSSRTVEEPALIAPAPAEMNGAGTVSPEQRHRAQSREGLPRIGARASIAVATASRAVRRRRQATIFFIAGTIGCDPAARTPGGEAGNAGGVISCPGSGPTGLGLGDSGSRSEVPDAGPGDAGTPPSCLAGGPGLNDCGSAKESCCTSFVVPGGSFYKDYATAGCTATGEFNYASVSTFRLDKYVVTVGRFRQFVNAVLPGDGGVGWLPDAGSGKHTHLNQGQGLLDATFDTIHVQPASQRFEAGWSTLCNPLVAPNSSSLQSCVGGALLGGAFFGSNWTDQVGANENEPIVCVNGCEAYAFCIWDGGFLPSDAEWVYAAAGGAQQREFPWGPADPGIGSQYAIYDCAYPRPTPSLACTSAAVNLAPVGTPQLGAGRWGQSDLAGEVWQQMLDGAEDSACSDCAVVGYRFGSPGGVVRGGSYESPSAGLLMPSYYSGPTGQGERRYDTGFRCARSP
jgi:sulfatase modifying factor 1